MAAETETKKNKSNDEESQKPVNSTEPDNDDSAASTSAESSLADSKESDSSNAESDLLTDQSTSTSSSNTSAAKSAASNDVPTDKTVDEPVANVSESAAELAPSHSQVEQKLAEMMDMDASDIGDKDTDSVKDPERQSTASNASIGDLNDLNDEADEMDVSDVSSSIAENEIESKAPSPRKKPRKRQPPIMIGYKKRRKVHSKKLEDDIKTESEIGSPINESVDEKSADESKKLDNSSGSSDDNGSETSSTKSTTRSVRKFSATCNEVAMVDKYCWICHKEGPNSYKCIACPRVYHPRCLVQTVEDPNNFHCPECSAILKADNVNTRSPVMQAVNLDQLCTLLKHVTDILKIQRDAHHFYGPVDTKEFPHYREYVVYPMDIVTLEKNVKNKVYGCTEAFLADMKWIVHNSIVFNTKTAKITNVAKNLLKTGKREVGEIETCAECYYNLLVHKDTWFIEVCKRPHLLIWARLKGYPPWPAKAIKCKDEMVDCRFFGAHDKAWVPVKDVYLYSKVAPQIVKVKPGSNLDEGIQEIEKHIKKLKDKFGSFVYAEYREPYNPYAELEQLKSMLPNYNPESSTPVTKPIASAPTNRRKPSTEPKTLFNESTTSSTPSTPRSKSPISDSTPSSAKTEPSSGESICSEKTISIDTSEPTSETAKLVCDESSLSASTDSRASNVEKTKNTCEDEQANTVPESNQTDAAISTASSAGSDKAPDSTDTEAEESDSSRSTTKSTSAGETSRKNEPVEKTLVSVKKIESINATVAPERTITRPVPIAPKPVPALVATNPIASLTTIVNSTVASTNGQLTRKITDTKMEIVRNVKSVEDSSSKPKSKITVKNFASFEKCDNTTNSKSSPATQAPQVAPCTVRKESIKVTGHSNDQDFCLDKVKDEPVEMDTSPQSEDPIFVKEIPPPLPPPQPQIRITVNKMISAKSTLDVAHRKRSMVEDTDSSSVETGKKSKNDTGCRTVNITENVTLSLINSQMASLVENVPAAVPTKTQTVLKPKPPTKTFVVASNVSSVDTPTLSTTHPHPNTITKPVRIAPAPGPTPIRMFTTAQQQRIVNGNAAMNGTPIPPRSNILVVQSPKQPIKNPTFGPNGSGDIMVQFMSELLNNNRRAMEDTLDKIAGKGDLRAKVILLQKEIETTKKNHDMMIDEIKRDYEVQIAELRAASIAQKKYDLAHERLKFEKEKEQAVKEAKSKQWCSNCQKSANYYCCWNTAYCDFECQKEHWNQHMHVCKNDVKRKTAECSENEPPRIMMQNDVLSDYKNMMNGYEKLTPATYTYQNSNNVSSSSRSNGGTKMQMKSSSTKNVRPLLPRVTATVTCSPSVYSSSTPAVTATLLDNSYQNVSTTVTPLRSTMIGSVNVHPLIRQAQQQFHK